jgi:acetyl esterase/lipase
MSATQQIETRPGIAYANHDGVSLAGDLYLPAGPGPFPALVGVHGGGWQAGARSTFQFWGAYLAEHGYALFAISYRLAKKGHKMFPQAVQDVLAGVQFVRGNAGAFKLDPDGSRCSAPPPARTWRAWRHSEAKALCSKEVIPAMPMGTSAPR